MLPDPVTETSGPELTGIRGAGDRFRWGGFVLATPSGMGSCLIRGCIKGTREPPEHSTLPAGTADAPLNPLLSAAGVVSRHFGRA